MHKPSIREALRMAKQVKLSLASGAEPVKNHTTPEDRERLYKLKARKQGKTAVDLNNDRQYEDWLLKECGF